MEKIVEQTLLYDFYGELLTERQRQIYEDIVFDDLSLGEAAAEYGISRQGIHDMIKRSEHAMREYEEKLHLVSRFLKMRELTGDIISLADSISKSGNLEDLKQIETAANRMKEILGE